MESSSLHMVELRPDLLSLTRFLHNQGLASVSDEDLGYGVHAWLNAAFGDRAPKPWRLFADHRRPTRILGYAPYDAKMLRARLTEFADPSVHAVCKDPDADILSRTMPQWQTGRRLRFEVQCCPVGRKAGSGVEKDLFLIKVERGDDGPITRESVYCEWVRKAVEESEAAQIGQIALKGFRLVRQTRKATLDATTRRAKTLTRPLAIVEGELTIADPVAFSRLLARGIGRHRAFGYGMILLRPAT